MILFLMLSGVWEREYTAYSDVSNFFKIKPSL
jgi:hypothetical protein